MFEMKSALILGRKTPTMLWAIWEKPWLEVNGTSSLGAEVWPHYLYESTSMVLLWPRIQGVGPAALLLFRPCGAQIHGKPAAFSAGKTHSHSEGWFSGQLSHGFLIVLHICVSLGHSSENYERIHSFESLVLKGFWLQTFLSQNKWVR